MSLSPAASRRRLGAELRGLREAAEMRVEDAARHLDCSTAKISRLENGKGVPYVRDVRDLLAMYGTRAKERSEELLRLAEDGRAQDWYSRYRDVLHGEMSADHLNRYFELERDANVIKAFEADLIPGLLQTERYIDAVCSIVYPENNAKERRRFVEFRLERQETILRRGRQPELSIILSELAVIRRIGGPAVLKDQLESMYNELTGPLNDVDFRLVPLDADTRGALGGPFIILKYNAGDDQDLVYLEGREGANWLESDGDVFRYEQLFSGLERDSRSREDSLAQILKVAHSLP